MLNVCYSPYCLLGRSVSTSKGFVLSSQRHRESFSRRGFRWTTNTVLRWRDANTATTEHSSCVQQYFIAVEMVGYTNALAETAMHVDTEQLLTFWTRLFRYVVKSERSERFRNMPRHYTTEHKFQQDFHSKVVSLVPSYAAADPPAMGISPLVYKEWIRVTNDSTVFVFFFACTLLSSEPFFRVSRIDILISEWLLLCQDLRSMLFSL